jgi:hypothetical protein
MGTGVTAVEPDRCACGLPVTEVTITHLQTCGEPVEPADDTIIDIGDDEDWPR